MKAYIYKLTVDNGSAPCAPKPTNPSSPALLSLAICKPWIRKAAAPGDRIIGITGKTIAKAQGYPINSIVYAAVVDRVVTTKDYSTAENDYRSDSIYTFNEATGEYVREGSATVHLEPGYIDNDLGTKSNGYDRARVILSHDFRYFGKTAVRISDEFPQLLKLSNALGIGHRVYDSSKTDHQEMLGDLDRVFYDLWQMPTAYTPGTERVVNKADMKR